MNNGKGKPESGSKELPSDKPSETWKEFDIEKAVRQDISAAVSLLHLVLDNPNILAAVTAEVEKIRARIIEAESMPKKEDFHPELTPNG